MALLICPDCKNKVSSLAKACPKCGCPIEVIKKANAGVVDPTTDRTGYLAQALNGNPEAQAEYAFCLDMGKNVEKDPRKAAYWAKKASDSFDPQGMYLYARCLMNPERYGTKKDQKMAFALLCYSANSNNENGQALLARFYINGWYPLDQKDEAVGYYWLSKAEEANPDIAKDLLDDFLSDRVLTVPEFGEETNMGDTEELKTVITNLTSANKNYHLEVDESTEPEEQVGSCQDEEDEEDEEDDDSDDPGDNPEDLEPDESLDSPEPEEDPEEADQSMDLGYEEDMDEDDRE